MTFDETTVRTWWDVLKHGRDLVEIRLLGQRTGSGYFRDCESIISALRTAPDGYGCYFTLNSLDDGVFGRKQHQAILFDKGITTTSDRDVKGRDWILIDLDPVRPSGCNSTDAELRKSREKANEIFMFLREQGFPDPVCALSGNGAHLYVPVALRNDDSTTTLVKEFLQALDMMFSDESVAVDISCSNASRIAKLTSTVSPKGANTADRPQRTSRFQYIPESITPVAREYIQKVASMLPKPEAPSRHNDYRPTSFDIDEFLRQHSVGVQREVVTSSHRKIILDHCPFDHSHRAPDAALFVMPNGAIGFRCLHAHCAHYTFKDFRLHFDPTAYSKTDYFEHRQKRQYYTPFRHSDFQIEEEDLPRKGKKWLAPTDVKYNPNPSPSIPTGYIELDRKCGGLVLGDITVISGINASGKTIWLNNVLMNAISRGYKAAVWSGELTSQRFFDWLYLVAAGKSRVRKIDGYDNFYRVPPHIAERISAWMNGKLWLYSQNYQNAWPQLLADLNGCLKLHGPNLIVIDNMTALDISEIEGDGEFSKQKSFVASLKNFARENMVHVILVVHPRKTTQFLRKEDLGGSMSLSNLADSVYIVHRTGRDFQQRASEFFKKDEVERLMQYSTVVEAAKNRLNGVTDWLLGLYYEPETKRLKENPADNISYGIFDDPAPDDPAPEPDPDPYAVPDSFLETLDEAPF